MHPYHFQLSFLSCIGEFFIVRVDRRRARNPRNSDDLPIQLDLIPGCVDPRLLVAGLKSCPRQLSKLNGRSRVEWLNSEDRCPLENVDVFQPIRSGNNENFAEDGRRGAAYAIPRSGLLANELSQTAAPRRHRAKAHRQ